MDRRTNVVLAGATLAGACSVANADLLFGIDVLSDTLVEINTATGGVSVVGDLRRLDATNVELAWRGDALYAVNTTFGLGAELVRINPHSGGAQTPVAIMLDGQAALSVEGLASDPVSGELWASFRMGQGATWQANGLGQLGTDGVISGAVDTMAVHPGADWDALEIMDTGVFIGADSRSNGPDVVDLHRVTLEPLGATLDRSLNLSDEFGSLNDFAVSNGRLFGIDTSIGQVIELDPVTLEILHATPLDPGYAIVGIAAHGVPAPGAVGLAALAWAGAARRRR